jgi:hypothetical protein
MFDIRSIFTLLAHQAEVRRICELAAPVIAEARRVAPEIVPLLRNLGIALGLPPRKAVGIIVIAIAFGLFAADWVAQKTGIPGGVVGLAFGFGAIWVVDRIDDGSLPKMLKGLLLRWVQK